LHVFKDKVEFVILTNDFFQFDNVDMVQLSQRLTDYMSHTHSMLTYLSHTHTHNDKLNTDCHQWQNSARDRGTYTAGTANAAPVFELGGK